MGGPFAVLVFRSDKDRKSLVSGLEKRKMTGFWDQLDMNLSRM